MAYAAIISTLIFGSLFVGISGFYQTSSGVGDFDSAAEEEITPQIEISSGDAIDTDGDGLPDVLEESQYGTLKDDPDTDNDGMSDGWEVAHGLNPLDSGEAEEAEEESGSTNQADGAEVSNESDSWPDPTQGRYGDPDNDGLTNEQEAELGTDPQRADTDNDGLNDRWESIYTMNVSSPDGTVTLFNPLSGNWDCSLLNGPLEQTLSDILEEFEGAPTWEELESPLGRHSCDQVLDFDDDGLLNFQEEEYGTNPAAKDSDNDMLPDILEVNNANMILDFQLGSNCGEPVITPPSQRFPTAAPFADEVSASWFLSDMDGDGYLNGPSDWDTDGDGMPDGFEYCFSFKDNHPFGATIPQKAVSELLNPSNASDGYNDWDEDGLNNLEEYEVALKFDLVNGLPSFTSPWTEDTDQDGMPDGWEASQYNRTTLEYPLNPRNASNANDDIDFDGWDSDGDGDVVFNELELTTTVVDVYVQKGDYVTANSTVARGQYTLGGGNKQTVYLVAPVDGYVYHINVAPGDQVETRLFVWMNIVEESERFTNLMEYEARFDDNGNAVGRSTDPTHGDTDLDGLLDGIEVGGWEILVVNRGVQLTWVVSDPGLADTDADGLSDFVEFSSACDGQGSNASNVDTDGDGESDQQESVLGYIFNGEQYFTSACMFDTDNDGLEDGEEVIAGADNFVTHANNSDTDDDGLIDGNEILFIPRPFQHETNPLINDTDADGMLDGWEMQVKSTEDNTNSHSLWVAISNWDRPGCTESTSNSCLMEPGGYVWINWLGGFELQKKYEVYEMNLSGFDMPGNPLCDGCKGRWALDPSLNSLKDDTYDIDNDTLPNGAESPTNWNTNPVDDDTDGDQLPDGWEVQYSYEAINNNLVDNATINAYGARGVMDPSMPDSDLDGINDGEEDPDQDGL
ncbi:MAG TPA: hypothetical protein HA320_00120, partial [Candidatus Poseidoniaceae archaeon]|nr:hypothetical protein [Candidatus Poseidoniaceae archaeon]